MGAVYIAEDEVKQKTVRNRGAKNQLRSKMTRFSLLLSTIIIILGILVLIGWIFDIGYLKSFFPNADPMTANAATLFILSGVAIFFCNLKSSDKKYRYIVIAICAAVIFIAVLTTLEYAFSVNFGIDELIFKDEVFSQGIFPPGRMTLLAAVNFILVGVSILLIYHKKWMNFSQSLTTAGLLLGGLSLIGYLYGVDSLYDISSYTQMTFLTTIAGIILNVCLLFSRPNEGLMRIITGDTLGGVMTRRLLPMAIAVPFIIGWFRLVGGILGLFTIEVGVSLMVFSTIIILVMVVWLNGLFLHRLDLSRRKLERDIIRARLTAESATMAKSEFLANMSHEIRTPINGITGMISLTMDSEMTPTQREYLQHASSSARTLTRIIDDILDFSKIEAGKLGIEAVDFNLEQVFDEMKAFFSNDAAIRGLTLTVEVHPDIPKGLVGDPVRLKQVLMNLLRNAMKFTHNGSISLKAEPELIPSDSKTVIRFSVIDTGIGISKENVNMIFEAFSQVDGSTTRLYGGTGLGLTISKKLVGMMGGKIGVESALGKGSSFFFSVPFTLASHPVARRAEIPLSTVTATIPRGLRIYLADDNEINRILMNNLLAKIGASVTTVDNGLDMLKAFETEPPDLILMDIQMPRMNGIDTTKRIREIEKKTGIHTPIIAVTGHALRGDREKFLAAGMDGYIPEPIDITAFFAMIAWFASNLPPEDCVQKSEKSIARTEEWIDMGDFMSRVKGDVELIDQLLRLYLEDSGKHLAQIEDAIRSNELTELERSAHSLKGMSANLSAYRVSELASRLEDMGESGDIGGANSVLIDLGESLNKTISYIERYFKERK